MLRLRMVTAKYSRNRFAARSPAVSDDRRHYQGAIRPGRNLALGLRDGQLVT